MCICDPHAHMISRTVMDYQEMKKAGIEMIVEPAFWLGEPRKHAGTFYDYFDHISHFERERAAENGIKHFCLIAVNPREANNEKLAAEVLKRLPDWLGLESVLGVGEIGFDDITPAEEKAIRAQLEIAKSKKLPVMFHLPHRRKLEGLRRTIEVLKSLKFPKDLTLLDHSTEETTAEVRAYGSWCGHTVYPVTKLTPPRAADIVRTHGVTRMMINSSADWGLSDHLAVPKTLAELRARGATEAELETLVWKNPLEFYRQSGKLVGVE